MTGQQSTFTLPIDFRSVLEAISKQIYDTPFAFLRENVQNAIDAVRIQAIRDQIPPGDPAYRVDIHVEGDVYTIRDHGIGMTRSDLQEYFWKIGASGKRTEEARLAGCVGMFGIGGFANFGVCRELEVISQTERCSIGTWTALSQEEIQGSGAKLPEVRVADSDIASPRGTMIVGRMANSTAAMEELREYISEIVRLVATPVYFNNALLPQKEFYTVLDRENYTAVATSQVWEEPSITVHGGIYEDRGHTLVAVIEDAFLDGGAIGLRGEIRFEAGAIDVLKRGFKLCVTKVASQIGVSGRLECDRFVPTAGRDSLDAPTTTLLNTIVRAIERVAVQTVLETSDRIAQYTRIFPLVVQQGMIERLGNVRVKLANGSEASLDDIRRSTDGGVEVFYGLQQKQALSQIMHAQGHIVVILSADRHRQTAERRYLEGYCRAKAFDGLVECTHAYEKLDLFERIFMSELELNIRRLYEIGAFEIIAGKLSENIPVFVKETSGGRQIIIYVDVRHPEITKLSPLGAGPLLYSMISNFCTTFLADSLKKWSPRYFGSGAINLSMFYSHRSELWILVKDDVGVIQKRGQRHVMTTSDVRSVDVHASPREIEAASGGAKPRILHVVDEADETGIGGYYLRLPDKAYEAYGDIVRECQSRGVSWGGNKVTFVVADTISTAVQYEVRLDRVVAIEEDGSIRSSGAEDMSKPPQEIYGGIYLEIPKVIERFLVPKGEEEIRLELYCELFETATSRRWTTRSDDEK